MNTKTISRLLKDLGIGVTLSGIAYLAGHLAMIAAAPLIVAVGIMGVTPLLYLLYFGLQYGGPAAIALVGLAKGRIGMVLGAPAFFIGLYLATGLSAENAIESARKLNQRTFAPIEGTPSIVMVGTEQFCRSSCIQILATTKYDFGGKGVLFKRLEGADCLRSVNINSYADFLDAGYVGLCAYREAWQGTDDAIVVVANDNDYREAKRIVGSSYTGHVFEAYERRAGRDRFLGRWLDGMIEESSVDMSSHTSKELKIGDHFEPEEFFAALLDAPIVHADTPGTADRDALLSALENVIDDAEVSRTVSDTYYKIAQELAHTSRPLLKKHMRVLLDSGQSKQIQVAFGILARSFNWPSADTEFVKPYIAAALQSGDMGLAAQALDASGVYPAAERAFIYPALIDIAFSPALNDKNAMNGARLPETLMSIPGDFDESLRRRAKDMLLTNRDVSERQAVAMLVILASGGEPARKEAFGVVQEFEGKRFERLVAVIDYYGWQKLSGTAGDDWNSSELALIAERLARVPTERIQDYLNAFVRQCRVDESCRAQVTANLENRIGSKGDRILQRYLRDLER